MSAWFFGLSAIEAYLARRAFHELGLSQQWRPGDRHHYQRAFAGRIYRRLIKRLHRGHRHKQAGRAETVENMLEDARAGRTLELSHPTAEAVTSMR